jgi:hypothetical protein
MLSTLKCNKIVKINDFHIKNCNTKIQNFFKHFFQKSQKLFVFLIPSNISSIVVVVVVVVVLFYYCKVGS